MDGRYGRISRSAFQISGVRTTCCSIGEFSIFISARQNGDNSPYVERTGPLLFAMVEGQNAYFIDVQKHGAWAKEELLRIVKNNWPHLLADHRLEGVVGLEPGIQDIGEAERKAARRAGVNVLLELDDEYFHSPGGGITCAGTSTEASLSTNFWMSMLDNLQEHFEKNADALVRSKLDRSTHITSPYRFSLTVQDGHVGVLEKRNAIFFSHRPLSPAVCELLETENSEYQGITDA
jgi:hypothetical protein